MTSRQPPDPVVVTLSPREMLAPAIAGVQRHLENLARKRENQRGTSDEVAWQIDIEGALGEVAYATWSNQYWWIGRPRDGDVGRVQVKTAPRPSSHLLVHPDSDDQAVFVLVTGIAPTYVLRGWVLGHVAKQPCFWKDPVGGRPAFFFPQSHLEPMSEIRIHAERNP